MVKSYLKYQSDTSFTNAQQFLQSDSSTAKKDTLINFGVENIDAIPTRKPKITKQIEVKPQKQFNPLVLHKNIDTWQSIVLFLLLILVMLSKAFNQNRFKQLLKSAFNYSTSLEVIREEKVFFHRANLWLTVVHVVALSLIIYELVLHPTPQLFFIIMGAIVVAYIVKYISAKAVFFIFSINELSSEYIFNISLYNNLLGIILIPVLMILYYTGIGIENAFMYLIAPILILIYLFRLVRIFIAGNNYRISYFYIFLYICTLEILPLVVLYKVLVLK